MNVQESQTKSDNLSNFGKQAAIQNNSELLIEKCESIQINRNVQKPYAKITSIA